MTEGLLTTASPQVIEKMIEEWAGHTHATDILDDLDPELLDRPFRPGATHSVGVKLLSLVSHDSYHLGQVVLLRRLLGVWPPPSGSDSE